MKLENQTYNKLFQTGNKELVNIVRKAIDEDNTIIINKVITTIKDFRKQTDLTKQFGNEILSDIANTLKGTNFFDDELSLMENYRLLENQKDILLKNLVSKKYEFTENQVKGMPSKILFYTLDNYKNSSYYPSIILDEINKRISNNELDMSNNNLEYLYLYLCMCNKLNKMNTLNELIKNPNFIKALDNADITGSMLISLTDECERPRTILLSNSKKIKYSITIEDELLTPKDLLESLTKEEILMLHKNIEISNALINNGIRFDALPEKISEKIISDTNNFTIFDMDTVVTLTNNYKDISKLANDVEYLMMYLSKLDHDIYDNKIFNYINVNTIKKLLNKEELYKLDKYTIVEFVESLSEDNFIAITSNKKIFEIINNNMNEIIFNKLNKTKQIKYFEDKKELDSYDIYLLSFLPKKEITRIFNEKESATTALKEYLKLNGYKDISVILENIPVKSLEEVTKDSINNLTIKNFTSLANNNIEALKITILNNQEILNDITKTNFDKFLNITNFSEKQILKLINNSEKLSQEVVRSLTNLLSEESKKNVFNVEIVRNKIIEDNKEVDEFTFNYLLTNVKEISKLDPVKIIDIINKVNDKNAIKIISNNEVLTKLYKEYFNEKNNFILQLNKVTLFIEYLNKTSYVKYYNKDLLLTVIDSLDIDDKKKFVSNDKLMKHVLEKDNIYKMFTNLMAKNTYLLETLKLNVLNEETSKMKTQYLEEITKYPKIEELIIEINKEHMLTSNFLTYLVNSITNLEYEKYLTMMLTYIKNAVYGFDRKNTTNIFSILPDKITKKETDILVEYLLYIDNFKELPSPTSLDELTNYTYNSEEELYKKIHKGEEKNIRDYFFKRHYKITLKQAENLLKKFSIERVDKEIYKEEVNFLLEISSIMNKELHILKEKDGKYKKISMYESEVMKNKIERMYQTIYNYELKAKAKAGRKLELTSFGKIISASETSDDFMYLIYNGKLNNKENNYLNNYIDTVNSIENISTTLVSNDNLAIKDREDIIFGYNHVSAIKNMSRYNVPREFIDNSRDNSNEIIISKYDNISNNNYILPDYILIYEDKINDILVEKAYRASIELGNKKPLPIIVIKEDKIIELELKKINELETKFNKTKDINILSSLFTKYCNNYNGLNISNKDKKDKFAFNKIIMIIEKESSRNNSKKALENLKNIVLNENDKYKKVPYNYQSLIKFINNKIK